MADELNHLSIQTARGGKWYASTVSNIEKKGNQVIYRFNQRTPVTPDQLIKLVQSYSSLSFTADGMLVDRLPELTPVELLERVSNTLRHLSVES